MTTEQRLIKKLERYVEYLLKVRCPTYRTYEQKQFESEIDVLKQQVGQEEKPDLKELEKRLDDSLAAELIEPYLMNLEGYPKIRFISQESCLEAMQAYHEAKRKEELINYGIWCGHDKTETEEAVKNYLTQRTNGNNQEDIY